MKLQSEIIQIQTPEQLQQWLRGKIHIIANSRHWNENSKHKEAVDFMIQYAHDHYAEEISLEKYVEAALLVSQLFESNVQESDG